MTSADLRRTKVNVFLITITQCFYKAFHTLIDSYTQNQRNDIYGIYVEYWFGYSKLNIFIT